MPRPNITQAELRRLIDYNPRTGLAVWKKCPRRYFRRKSHWLTWNKKWAGKPAFHAPHNMGYYQGSLLGGGGYLAHQIFWFYMTGEWADEIDHDDGNGRNNKWDNIFDRSHQDNMRNRKVQSNNKVGVTGVYKLGDRYVAQIELPQLSGKRRNVVLGRFQSLSEAAAARKAADVKFGFHRNHGR